MIEDDKINKLYLILNLNGMKFNGGMPKQLRDICEKTDKTSYEKGILLGFHHGINAAVAFISNCTDRQDDGTFANNGKSLKGIHYE